MAFSQSVGRPKSSLIWDNGYFNYDIEKDQCECLITEKDRKCGRIMRGKNPTNLKAHLLSQHKQVYAKLLDLERKLADSKKVGSTKTPTVRSTENMKIHDFLQAKSRWPIDSTEYKKRVDAFAKAIVDTSISTCVADNVSFKQFCTVMDPKFTVPGKKNYVLTIV